MDHRASHETDQINTTNHELLKYVGGRVSLEMQCPKLLWIKKNLPNSWNRIGRLFDLPDFLTWKSTGCDSRYNIILYSNKYIYNKHFQFFIL